VTKKYLKLIADIISCDDAREESFYSAISDLFQKYADEHGKTKTHITTLPKQTEAGNPDFRVWDGKQHIVGYIEAKALTVKNLDAIENSEQLKRYRHTFPNLILTNFTTFRLYRNGELTETVQIARPYIFEKLKTVPPVENEDAFFNLLEKFYSFSLPKVNTAKNLATELAKRTRFLRDEIITEEIKEEESGKSGAILSFFHAFQKYLIQGITHKEFADLFSQTITYGLFAARARNEESFSRKLAYDRIPHTIGILRDVFYFISGGDLPQVMEWIIDDIAEVLEVTEVNQILREYFLEGKGKDPVVHFYETFLAEYDPETRERRGVYYTPEPVVSYIVRSVHHLLKTKFEKADGLANEDVTLLDPAGGTLTFLTEAAKQAVKEYETKFGEGGKSGFIRSTILKNFYAFELMMAPYAIGHLKMAFFLEELGYHLTENDRFQYYLTNTLEMDKIEVIDMPILQTLSEESHKAGKIKQKKPILAIIGNPPYSGHSANKGEWIIKLLKEGYKTPDGRTDDGFYKVDGKPLEERNPKWLQDDYVKFIRFAQWKIDQAGEGILGFITNHSYFDNPTFRGMRQSLMSTFDEIYLLDLHGNSLKKEKCPDGSVDQNVFDIRQGVAMALFVKSKPCEGSKPSQGCQIFHADLYGKREGKYNWLDENDITTTDWIKLKPKSEFYLFIPRDEKLEKQYSQFWKITDIFPVNSVGIVTSRDKFVIDYNFDALKRRIRMFKDEKLPNEIVAKTFGLKDKKGWKLSEVRKSVREDKNWEKEFTKILYRPFDERHIFYHDAVIERSRKNVMRHMMQENLGLITHKRKELDIPWKHAFLTNFITEHGATSSKTTNYHFPLYLYPEMKEKKRKSGFSMTIFEPKVSYGKAGKIPNIAQEVFVYFEKLWNESSNKMQNRHCRFTPELIFYYIYAVLYAPIYRKKYAEFLKTDFPRVPFTKNGDLFLQLAEFGKRLADLHLLKSKELDVPIAKFHGAGDNSVEKIKLCGSSKLPQSLNRVVVYINSTQYFSGISKEVWNYHIGGYQVLNKWLKDRKKRKLSVEEIKTYCRIVTALSKTMEIQGEIDKIYPKVEKQ